MVSTKSITITGVDGFVGKHVAREAKSRGLYVRGIARSAELSDDLFAFVDEYFSADLVGQFPSDGLSDSVIHLAGLAAVGPSFESPQNYITNNSSMVTNLCEGILAANMESQVRVIAVSTGAVYRSSNDDSPIVECDETFASSPYVVSKLLVEEQMRYYSTRGLTTTIARPFNHIGPGQSRGFIVPDMVQRRLSLGNSERMTVGNLESRRDYLDVRDVARAYIELAISETAEPGIVNVCSGIGTSGSEILSIICEELALEVPQLAIDETLIRPNDPSVIVGSADKLKSKLNWAPTKTVRESIRDFVSSNIT